MTRFPMIAVLGLSLGLLVACDTAEERAEAHFAEGVALLEAGDVDRALVEFRNVFRLDGFHREARRLYAEAELERGNLQSGYSNYLRLVEQYPDDVDARRRLTEVALDRADWEEVARHAEPVIAATPDDPLARLAEISLRYRDAVAAEDAAARAEAAADARALQEVLTEEPLLYELSADHLMREGRREQALDELDKAIAADPDRRSLYRMRLALLQEMGDFGAVEAQLREMARQFPDDAAIPSTLIRWYISRDNLDAAEAYLRERADIDEDGEVRLVEFLTRYRGIDAAVDELDRMIAEGGDTQLFRSIRAGLDFQRGRRQEAIDEMQAILDAADAETDRVRDIKVSLAQMLERTGNEVGARALVEEVLGSDPNHVAALKMRADDLIDADETDEAILTLRSALDQSPRDPQLMTLMARAHERGGNRALMGEMLSLAVEASNNAPDETVRYARYLVADDNPDVAEAALMDSLRLNPDSLDLLQLLGNIYVEQGDWSRAEQVAQTVERMQGPAAEAAANTLTAQILAGRGQTEEVVGFLDALVEEGRAGVGAQVAIVRTHIQNGDLEAARDYVGGQLAQDPDDPALRFIEASLAELSGATEQAERTYETLLEEDPGGVAVWRALYLLQMREGREEAAQATLDRALEANPASLDLLWAKASVLQNADDLEGALEIYERMYAQNSSAPVIANNLASLLTMLRDDQESIDRAYAIARRLRDAEVPAFQDTFGWIAFLRGEYDLALQHLEPAAAALPQDPLPQYHLARTYEALDRSQEAEAAFARAVEVAGPDSALPQVEEARRRLEALRTAQVETD